MKSSAPTPEVHGSKWSTALWWAAVIVLVFFPFPFWW
jgi:hypothetical protein